MCVCEGDGEARVKVNMRAERVVECEGEGAFQACVADLQSARDTASVMVTVIVTVMVMVTGIVTEVMVVGVKVACWSLWLWGVCA